MPQNISRLDSSPPRAPAGPEACGPFRSLLVLGRISNLPTVWSNCLAASLLAGAAPLRSFGFLIAGATCLYLGGMFLNDAMDAPFDRQFRPERPIPSGRMSRGAAVVWTLGLLTTGWLVLLLLGSETARISAVLLGAIVLYDVIHKRTVFAPFLMGICRFLLYLTAAASTKRGQVDIALVPALGMGAYVSGLSLFARTESEGKAASFGLAPDDVKIQNAAAAANPSPRPAKFSSPGSSKFSRWGVMVLAIALLAVPLVLTFNRSRLGLWDRKAIFIGAGVWILWWLRPRFFRVAAGSNVPGLLAGIVLVDWLYAPVLFPLQPAIFGILFCLALILQRVVPAS